MSHNHGCCNTAGATQHHSLDCFCGKNVYQFIGRLVFIETSVGPLIDGTPARVLCFDEETGILTVQSTGGTVFYICCKKIVYITVAPS
ncbi:hypothetical protein [Sutcliffiella horikoshii]|uniref:hypothetical protein n=1 Tax=Sutcliffiella horikoshii TaxID=79883 RepID=UPI0038512DA1